MAGEELLHGGLFEVALLGDELVQPAEQRIHIPQRLRDGALFGEGWEWQKQPRQNVWFNRRARRLSRMTSIESAVLCQLNIERR